MSSYTILGLERLKLKKSNILSIKMVITSIFLTHLDHQVHSNNTNLFTGTKAPSTLSVQCPCNTAQAAITAHAAAKEEDMPHPFDPRSPEKLLNYQVLQQIIELQQSQEIQ